MTEIWDLVDKNGRDVGIKWPRDDHDNIPDGLCHPCVEVWVKVKDKLLITRRHPSKSQGLKYDLPGGAVVSGEGILEGAARELFEEVGISCSEDELIPLGRAVMGKVYACSFILKLSELPPLTLQESEVVSYRLVSREEFESMGEEITTGTNNRYRLYGHEIF